MKAVALFAGLLLSTVAACACAQAADGLPVLRGDRAKPVASGEVLLPAAAGVGGPASGTPAARAPAAARRAPPTATRLVPTRAAGGDAGGDGAARLPDANSRAPAQPLRARPVLSWQSLLPGSIQ
ncbi:MAG: hypothetical protein M0P72_08175 [Metallibacterium scheffleri]|uniref:hypothetical protein n=1 Tax=Metallibacterium scheffleri TaxID=993689 RepID=UPI0026F12580|nr:hypothetical protein [Metallibacterium scheffleri]MCK9367109.1 hypothetical protein [Metallibacterium scheffleri]